MTDGVTAPIVDRRGLGHAFDRGKARLHHFRWPSYLLLLNVEPTGSGQPDRDARRAAAVSFSRAIADAVPFEKTIGRHGRHEMVILLWNIPESVARLTARHCEEVLAQAERPSFSCAGVGMAELDPEDDLATALAKAQADLFGRTMPALPAVRPAHRIALSA
jgi:hypothetical protein